MRFVFYSLSPRPSFRPIICLKVAVISDLAGNEWRVEIVAENNDTAADGVTFVPSIAEGDADQAEKVVPMTRKKWLQTSDFLMRDSTEESDKSPVSQSSLRYIPHSLIAFRTKRDLLSSIETKMSSSRGATTFS